MRERETPAARRREHVVRADVGAVDVELGVRGRPVGLRARVPHDGVVVVVAVAEQLHGDAALGHGGAHVAVRRPRAAVLAVDVVVHVHRVVHTRARERAIHAARLVAHVVRVGAVGGDLDVDLVVHGRLPPSERAVAQELRVRRVVRRAALRRRHGGRGRRVLGAPAVGVVIAHGGVLARLAAAVDAELALGVHHDALVGHARAPARPLGAVVRQVLRVRECPHRPHEPQRRRHLGDDLVPPRREDARSGDRPRGGHNLVAVRAWAQVRVVLIPRSESEDVLGDAVDRVRDDVDVLHERVRRVLVLVAAALHARDHHRRGVQPAAEILAHRRGLTLILHRLGRRRPGLIGPAAPVRGARPVLRDRVPLADLVVKALQELRVREQVDGAVLAPVDGHRLARLVGE
mmetsp:Transcript_27682/g.95769  ORF Transcript_27682/g.95769 Transcript_27682/m.95769 type:complete len:404 (-) Transcript_27682:326-1537(-)